MDDIFDEHKDTRDVELELANAEWRKNMEMVTLNAEREGLSDGFNQKREAHFDQGLNAGFEAVKILGILKGRLMKIQSVKSSSKVTVDTLMEDLKNTEADIVRWLASQKSVNQTMSSNSLDPLLHGKILRLKVKVEDALSESV